MWPLQDVARFPGPRPELQSGRKHNTLAASRSVCEGDSAIKGPALRQKFDVRRCWQCPKCGRIQKTPLEEVSYRCNCQPGGTWMKVFDQPPVPANLYQPNADELAALQFDFGVRPSGDPELAQEGGQRPSERRGPPRRDGDFRQRDDRRPQRDDRSYDRGGQQQSGTPATQASAPEAQSTPPSELAPQENSGAVPDDALQQTPPPATTEPRGESETDQFGSGLE